MPWAGKGFFCNIAFASLASATLTATGLGSHCVLPFPKGLRTEGEKRMRIAASYSKHLFSVPDIYRCDTVAGYFYEDKLFILAFQKFHLCSSSVSMGFFGH